VRPHQTCESAGGVLVVSFGNVALPGALGKKW
jgi:hypothetical protein